MTDRQSRMPILARPGGVKRIMPPGADFLRSALRDGNGARPVHFRGPLGPPWPAKHPLGFSRVVGSQATAVTTFQRRHSLGFGATQKPIQFTPRLSIQDDGGSAVRPKPATGQ